MFNRIFKSIFNKNRFDDQLRDAVNRLRSSGITQGLKFEGLHFSEIHRTNGEIDFIPWHNDVVNVGKNAILNAYFNGTSAFGTPYMGLITNTGFSTLAATDTMASHAGWAEFTGYSGGSRPAWGQGTAASQQITNATQVSFTITTSTTLYGGFIVNDNTLGGTAGTLWSTGALTAGNTNVNNGDVFKNSYILLC